MRRNAAAVFWHSPFGFGQSLQIFVVALARVGGLDDRLSLPHSLLVWSNPLNGLAFDQSALRQPLQHPGEDPLMGLSIEQTPGPRNRHMVWRVSSNPMIETAAE